VNLFGPVLLFGSGSPRQFAKAIGLENEGLAVSAEQPLFPCPGCGFLTYMGGPAGGTFVICPVCRWEDDNVQLADPNFWGGANALSLVEHQSQVLEQYPLSIQEYKGFERDPQWRPIEEH
jgi:hypothetical protein